MAIDTKHPTVTEAEDMWDICEAFVEGSDAVKSEGEEYLPRLGGQTTARYNAYKDRAVFYAAASKTCAGLLGAVFYKRPEITLPERIAYLESSATNKGASLSDLAVQLVKELLVTGRAGLLVERPANGGEPYLVMYDADDVINWDLDSAEQFIVLEEDIYVKGDDKYELEEKEQYRELMLDANGNYVVNVWQEQKDAKSQKTTWKIVQTSMPTKAGRAMDYIPFTCITPDGLTFDIVKPPLYDLVEVNLQHYRVSADHNNALHTICAPTPWIAGDIDNSDGKLTFDLGTESAWVLPAGSQVGFLELKGQGLQPVENMLDRLENMAVSLGARFVTQSKISTGVETAKGSEIRENQATEILASILIAVEAGLERALRICADWEGANAEEVSIKINKDLVKTSLDANMLNSLVNALQKGTISPEAFYGKLAEANMYAADSTFEKEQAGIKKYMESVAPAEPATQNQITPATTA